MRNQKGITLIALIITIIVLLILAGVSISMVVGDNGILTQAGNAKEETSIAEEKEFAETAYSSASIENYGNGAQIDKVQSEIDKLAGNGKAQVTQNEDGTFNIKYIDSGREYIVGKILNKNAINWRNILEEANETPEKYKYSEDIPSEYIAIGTDGKAVDMRLWNPTYNNDTDSFSLGSKSGSYGQSRTYVGAVIDGKIQGEVPQYIYTEALGEFKPVTHMLSTFSYLSDLKIAPEIPTTVVNMDFTFFGCSDLLVASAIPSGVISMGGTFSDCRSLVSAPIIPESVEIMSGYVESIELRGTFSKCLSLTGDLIINANPVNYESCLYGVASNSGCSLKLSGSSTKLNEILETAVIWDPYTLSYLVIPNVTLK